MKINLKDLAYIDDRSFLYIILSSADRFPGLYRFTSSWKEDLEESDFLKVLTFFEACFKTDLNYRWSKSDWLKAHGRFYEMGFGSKGRNSFRQDVTIGESLRKKSVDWIKNTNSLSLAAIETYAPVVELQAGFTYYVMGSLIRFTENETLVSYNDFDKSCYRSLKVSFDEVNVFVKNAFSKTSLSELFFRAEIIGRLNFGEDGKTELEFNRNNQNELLSMFTPGSPVFGSIDYPDILPIRFAKLVGVSNVCR
jgi:hypothetical protein